MECITLREWMFYQILNENIVECYMNVLKYYHFRPQYNFEYMQHTITDCALFCLVPFSLLSEFHAEHKPSANTVLTSVTLHMLKDECTSSRIAILWSNRDATSLLIHDCDILLAKYPRVQWSLLYIRSHTTIPGYIEVCNILDPIQLSRGTVKFVIY